MIYLIRAAIHCNKEKKMSDCQSTVVVWRNSRGLWCSCPEVGPGGIARPFSTQIISVNRDVKQISVGFKKVTVEASEMTVGYMTV